MPANLYRLTIDLPLLSLSRHVDKAFIKNLYVDVDDTHIITAPLEYSTTIVAGLDAVVVLPATTFGSVYQIQLFGAGGMVLSAFFGMPDKDCLLSEIDMHTAYPPRVFYPNAKINWGRITGDINDQADLTDIMFTKTAAGELADELDSLIKWGNVKGSILDQEDLNDVMFTKTAANELKEELLSVGITGDDAYEVAVKDGFVGTRSEWLASLVGLKGDKGDKGMMGLKGDKGDPGDDADNTLFRQELDAQKVDTGINVSSLSAEDTLKKQSQINNLLVNPKRFGVVANGINNDTEGLRKYHSYCNAHEIKASYAGLTSLNVDANASILVNTDFDFAGCEIVIKNSHLTTSRDITYLITDPNATTYTRTVTLDAANVKLWSLLPTKGVWDNTGYASITAPLQMCDRDNASTRDFQQSFWLLGGQAVRPLCADLSGFNTVSLTTRPMSKKRLKIENVRLRDDGFDLLTLISVQRNQVDIDGFTVINAVGRASDSLDILVNYRTCGDCTLSNFNVIGRPYVTGGTYVVSLTYTAEIYFNKFKGVDGVQSGATWGVTGSNYVSGCYIDNSSLNRFDVHAMGYHIYYKGGTLQEGSLQVGCGGGVFSVAGTTVIRAPAFAARPDYGSHYLNCTIIVKDIDWIPLTDDGGANQALVNLGGNRAGLGGKAPVTVPNVSISGIDIISPNGDTGQSTCYLYSLRVNPNSEAVMPFNYIAVSDIKLPSRMRWGINGDFNSLEQTGAPNNISRLILNDILGAGAGSYTSGVSGAGITFKEIESKTPVKNIALQFKIDNVHALGLHTTKHASLNKIEISNSTATHLYVGTVALVEYYLRDVRFIGNSSYTAVGKVLGNQSASATRPQHIYNCQLTTGLADYDFSSANAIVGSVLAANAILPVGASQKSALTGWTLATLSETPRA